MAKISRRKILKILGSSSVGSLLGISMMNTVAKGSEFDLSTKLKVIVVGAHPDDPETGCGGTMALMAKEGHDVISAYLTCICPSLSIGHRIPIRNSFYLLRFQTQLVHTLII